ncbi:hypothetical protein [Oscillatoria sp. FACHB-1406]|uniref:hypothetical protein n=1 Tax=Oscillatoria sp. FACHB-1406 TaxID=2692846 RepID=UPI0016822B4E|nr:hypothetical protein [Oscillatoria sp. FACHB-1406]MBD2578875.1 hypothetical protein [Oscillatoria sp. FACHB-1406]
MAPNPLIIKSVETLRYRVTAGDVAAQAGLEIESARQGLLALASDAGGHLQVSESGEIAYLFPKNFRGILRNKYWRLRWQETWQKIWGILFYLIRISFGIALILSIVLMAVAIVVIFIAISSSSSDDSGSSSSSSNSDRSSNSSHSGSSGFTFWWPDFYYWFDPGYRRQQRELKTPGEMNFLEAIFSFLFGDGNPNANLEQERWQTIGSAIQSNRGAVAAEQIAPYLDEIKPGDRDNEDYILPVLVRFNGYPQVSDRGQIVYSFPDLQVTARESSLEPIAPALQERFWRFSAASTGQIILAIGLGTVNIILALVLYSFLQDPQVLQMGGVVGFASSIYGLLAGYATAFLTIPLVRYFWIQWKNPQIASRNQQRLVRANYLQQPDAELQQKIAYARQFSRQNRINESELAYTTETDLLEQNLNNAERLDREWQERLDSGT